jgi:hypothetical protein
MRGGARPGTLDARGNRQRATSPRRSPDSASRCHGADSSLSFMAQCIRRLQGALAIGQGKLGHLAHVAAPVATSATRRDAVGLLYIFPACSHKGPPSSSTEGA